MEMKTNSGDIYGKVDGTQQEIDAYYQAVDDGDWDYVMEFETGQFGWRFVRSG